MDIHKSSERLLSNWKKFDFLKKIKNNLKFFENSKKFQVIPARN